MQITKLLSIADAVTFSNLSLGFLAIIVLFSDQKHTSFSLILLAVILDGLDGIIARKWKGEVGRFLDSLADLSSFSLAPTIFVFKAYSFSLDILHTLLMVILLFFLSTSALRLAIFPIMKKENLYTGLPSPAGAMFIILFSFLEVRLIYLLPLIGIVSLAMVSNFRFPKLGLKSGLIGSALIIIAIFIGKAHNNIALFLLLASLSFYSLVGPLYLKYKSFRNKCSLKIFQIN